MQWPNCGIALEQNWNGIADIFNIKVVGKNYDYYHYWAAVQANLLPLGRVHLYIA